MRLGRERYRRLLAVQHVSRVGAGGAELEVGRVRSPARLGEAEGDERASLADAGNDVLRDLRAGVGGDDGAVERSEELHVGDVHVAARDVLDDEAARDAAEVEPAERLRQVDPDEAERAHLLDELGLDAGLGLTLPIAGGEPLLREAARHVAHRELFVAESEVHVIAPGSRPGARDGLPSGRDGEPRFHEAPSRIAREAMMRSGV